MTDPRTLLIDTLRGRVLRGLRAGTLTAGARLPSARDLVAEFDLDHRIILAAYRELADEGLVEVRERGGVYVAATHNGATVPALPIAWIVDTLTEAYARELPAAELPELLRRSIETLRLRALVVSSTEDQVAGLARELRDDFGLPADGVVAATLAGDATPAGARRADVMITTRAHVEIAQRLASRLGKPMIEIDVRPDLVAGEWAMLLRQPVWAIVATRDFGDMLRHFFRDVRGIENLRVLVLGEDDLSTIPEGAATYVTSRVREGLDLSTVAGRVLPPARTIAPDSARLIFDFLVQRNLRAARAATSG